MQTAPKFTVIVALCFGFGEPSPRWRILDPAVCRVIRLVKVVQGHFLPAQLTWHRRKDLTAATYSYVVSNGNKESLVS